MIKGSRLSRARLRELIECDYSKGRLFWNGMQRTQFADGGRAERWNRTVAGKELPKRINDDGYEYVVIERRNYLVHRLILTLAGYDLSGWQVDHINGDRKDNRLSNIRPATAKQNSRNQAPRRGCASEYKGVSKLPDGRFKASINVDGSQLPLGTFKHEAAAAVAYDRAAQKHFGEFARLNF